MQIEKIHPDFRKVMSRIPSIPFHNPILLPIIRFLTRLPPPQKTMPGIIVSEQELNIAKVRIYRPEGKSSGAGLLWIHGGGMIVGSTANNERECSQYAKELKLVVVSVEYRLAPKHPFPCALDDCYEAWLWMQKSAATLGISADRIVISGQSAGGGLAASLVQKIVDEGGVQPAGQALFCPMLDDRTAARRELDDIKHRIWNNKNNRGAWAWYLGHSVGEMEIAEYAAPARRKNLSGLPPTWIGVGDIDLFYEEDYLYATRLKEAGVNCHLEVAPGAPHSFELFFPESPVTRVFLNSNYNFLRETLSI
jgi:acetyl esterase/lipase